MMAIGVSSPVASLGSGGGEALASLVCSLREEGWGGEGGVAGEGGALFVCSLLVACLVSEEG